MKKISISFLITILVLSSFYFVHAAAPHEVDAKSSKTTVVQQYGQLKVSGSKLCNQDGKKIQLKGMSTHGLQWFPVSAKAVDNLADNWKCSVIRAAMYTAENGYIGNEEEMKSRVTTIVDEAIKKGIYVIIDWHSLSDNDPNTYKSQAKEFFAEMSKKYGSYPNVIYEICNEPNGKVAWKDIKTYADEVIPEIRKNDSDNIIIVGTDTWSQGVDKAADDPIKGENIMYALHFYAGTHGEYLRNCADYALSKGIAIFVSEWGTTDSTGNGKLYLKESKVWTDWMKKNNLSWCNWSYCNLEEGTAALKTSANMDTAASKSDLSKSGNWIKNLISSKK